MRNLIILLSLFIVPLSGSAKMMRDTLTTRQNDRIILTYDLSVNGDNVLLKMDTKPRISPSDKLNKECKGDLGLLKVVLFDRIGDYGKVKWKGMAPSAFTVPSGLSYDKSVEGFHILGETTTVPISFTKKNADVREISFPLYIAVYEKKQTYKLVGSIMTPWKISIAKPSVVGSKSARTSMETEQIAIQSSMELEGDNDDVIKALSSMQLVRQMISSANEFPFSQSLQMEIFNLRSLKDRIKDQDVIDKINEVLLLCDDKERELNDSQRELYLASQAQEQAMIAQQKAEEEARLKEAEEKAREQEEKQQKRTIWMIIGGAILGLCGFIGNAVLKHFRDVKNQKSIMEMQQSLAKQAEHEASRRSREIVRNKAHQMANNGKTKMRESLKGKSNSKKNTKIKSI